MLNGSIASRVSKAWKKIQRRNTTRGGEADDINVAFFRTVVVAVLTILGAKRGTKAPRLGFTTAPDGAIGSESRRITRGTRPEYISSTIATVTRREIEVRRCAKTGSRELAPLIISEMSISIEHIFNSA